MKLLNPIHTALSLSLLAASGLFQPAFAVTTAADQDNIRVHTSHPKKTSDSLFSATVEWRIDDNELYRTNGLSFLSTEKSDGLIAAKKLATALSDGMTELYPSWRGIKVSHPKDQPELTIANKAGFSLTSATFKDYSNQALSYDLVDKSFNSDGVQVAIDLVYAADVEYLEGFTSKKSQLASQGDIEITIDEQKPVLIKTDGKTTHELEVEIARQLTSSQLSETPLFPSIVGGDTRNNKPFDGSEVQLLNLAAKSITINNTDPNLGVLTKFKFKDENSSVKVVAPMSMLWLVILGGILAGGYFWFSKTKKQA
jgi:hypothetical protein